MGHYFSANKVSLKTTIEETICNVLASLAWDKITSLMCSSWASLLCILGTSLVLATACVDDTSQIGFKSSDDFDATIGSDAHGIAYCFACAFLPSLRPQEWQVKKIIEL